MITYQTPQIITNKYGTFFVPKSPHEGRKIIQDICKGSVPEKGLATLNLRNADIGARFNIIVSPNKEHGYRGIDALEAFRQIVSRNDSSCHEEATPIPIEPFSSVYANLTALPVKVPVQSKAEKIIILLEGAELEQYDLNEVFFNKLRSYLSAYTVVYLLITECESVPSSFESFIQATRAALIDAHPVHNTRSFYSSVLFDTAAANGVSLSPGFLTNSYEPFMDFVMDLSDFRCDFILKLVLSHATNKIAISEESYHRYMAGIFFSEEWEQERIRRSLQKTAILSSVANGALSTDQILDEVERYMRKCGYTVEPFLIRLHLIRLWRTEQYAEFWEQDGWTLTEKGKAYLISPASDERLSANYANDLILKGGDL